VTGALRDSDSVDPGLRERLWRAIVDDGALLNNAATEEGGGSPARGAIPGTIARRVEDGTYRLTGEKTWTTWLPSLSHAIVTARIDPVSVVGRFVVDLRGRGVTRSPGFEALGMRGSASGRLQLDGAPGEPTVRLPSDDPAGEAAAEDRGATPAAWFGIAVAATYLGVGEGARRHVARWALDRRPGDGSMAVAELPSVQLRLGRLHMQLRTARIVVLEAARRWDAKRDATDVPLAKLVATSAAVDATDEAMRIAGGPGFLAGPLERAFRDTRAGLINPPLEDVALTGFARAVLERESGG
jgi:alkylation response protein AidB-like acyl-CoA dehydrogenase